MNIAATIITAVISTTVGVVVTAVIAYLRSGKVRHKAVENGVQSLLRAEIIRQNEKWVAADIAPFTRRTRYGANMKHITRSAATAL